MTPAPVRQCFITSPETTGSIELNFHMETLKDGGTKASSDGLGHMTKMVATPIYGKNHFFLLQNQKTGDLGS